MHFCHKIIGIHQTKNKKNIAEFQSSWLHEADINKGFPHISSILQKFSKKLINLFLKIIFHAITYKPMLVFQLITSNCSNEVFSIAQMRFFLFLYNQEFFFQLLYNVLVLLVILCRTFFCFFFIYHIHAYIWLFSIFSNFHLFLPFFFFTIKQYNAQK